VLACRILKRRCDGLSRPLLLEISLLGFGVSAIHRQPRRRSHGCRQTLTELIPRSSKRPWQRNLPRNEIRRRRPQQSRRSARRHRPITLDSRRSVSSHSAIFLVNSGPAQRCQRSSTPPVEAFSWEPTTRTIVLMFRRPLPSYPEPICDATPPEPLVSDFFTSLETETAFGILRTNSSCRPDAPRFEKAAHRHSREAFRSELSFRLRRPRGPSIYYWNLLPNSR